MVGVCFFDFESRAQGRFKIEKTDLGLSKRTFREPVLACWRLKKEPILMSQKCGATVENAVSHYQFTLPFQAGFLAVWCGPLRRFRFKLPATHHKKGSGGE